ncbi:hypothetical protein [Streptomyces spongiae]|uniref:Uncharacterized protein n=1 Tax=Streptomyces spongiae TaxID=565072 RepID=A0A5N8XPT0_9ACTN|nr:hypothetical protein [Streptomyces spongiae]MPY60585.1 hypothetical protein [Streptomyces spongiae]
MSARFVLYGIKGTDADEVAHGVADVLGIEFSLRNSSYKRGSYYFHRGAERLSISIERHAHDDEGVLGEPQYPQYGVLVYVNYSVPEVEQKLSTLEQIELLRTETV